MIDLKKQLPMEILSFFNSAFSYIYEYFSNVSFMKGVSYLTDDQNRKKAVVIELSTLERYDSYLEDLLDGLIAESRKDDEKIPLAKVISNLKNAGKLK